MPFHNGIISCSDYIFVSVSTGKFVTCFLVLWCIVIMLGPWISQFDKDLEGEVLQKNIVMFSYTGTASLYIRT